MKRYEGTILTCDENDTVVRHLVEENGMIVYAGLNVSDTGSNEEIRFGRTE